MFVRKLVEKAAAASTKKPGGNVEGLKAVEVDPVMVFHYGVPSGCTKFACDTSQGILAVSTKDGRIKLFGPDSSQAMLQSDGAGPSKYLQFIENQGVLLNVTLRNRIEAWDLENKILSHIYEFEREITAFEVLQRSLYIYVGDSAGNISVLKFDQDTSHLIQMKYTIPFAISHGDQNHLSPDSSVVRMLPQPTAESKRVLIIYKDGLITLWDIHQSKPIFSTSGNNLQTLHSERKQATSACWACPLGSKVVIGYNTGDILFWSIPGRTELALERGSQAGPICKLNIGYKLDKIPVSSIKWVHGDGRTSRLYIMGASDVVSTILMQVVLLNDHIESRTIKLGLQLPEPCIDMEIFSSTSEHNKHNQNLLLTLGKSGRVFAYDDSAIEKYLLQSQSKSSPSLPREVTIKLPSADSTISISKLIMNSDEAWTLNDEAKHIPSLFALEKNAKEGTRSNFRGFSKVKYLYITGHSNGCVNFWDGACPFFPILSLEQQSEGDFSLSGVTVTALCFDSNSRILVSGDKCGTVRIFKFKTEAYNSGSTKKGNNHLIDSVKVHQLNGTILSINISNNSGHIAVGSDQGYVSLIEVEGLRVLCTESIQSGISSGIIALQFASCSLHGFEKNMMVVATRDSSVLALDSDTGKTLSSGMVNPKKPSKALFMEVFMDGCTISSGRTAMNCSNPEQGLVLLCSEKAVYLYSLNQVVQGVKKVIYKKKFHSVSCCWASTFYGPAPGLVLLFTCGKIEIRSLPELSLLKEASIRGFTYSESSICSSQDGQILMVTGDQELYLFSILQQKNLCRLFESIGQVYLKNLNYQGRAEPLSIVPKEKKKGLFSSVFGETKSGKEKQALDLEREDPQESFEGLPAVFSTEKFPCEARDGANQAIDNDTRRNLHGEEDDTDLNIDDIDLEDFEEKPRGQNMFAGLNKKNLSSKFLTFKGKLKTAKAKNDKNGIKEEQQDEKVGAVDQIKKKYGFATSSESTTSAKMAENKLQEHLNKLQGISLKATQMQDTAMSFSAMAKELLKTAEQDKRSL
ncbi:uncharacterized protein LOC116215316 isoform X2 [Punica granatum]|uniref:Uncharacterized protein LOC116215316 isoform X2 n=1 Tax=Punica granatum TaxID=22663 RepID=A0A6P8ELU9_PUNGR|nr:uncharacterized protein LOC116215316 isoform X2 [Punica granatum]